MTNELSYEQFDSITDYHYYYQSYSETIVNMFDIVWVTNGVSESVLSNKWEKPSPFSIAPFRVREWPKEVVVVCESHDVNTEKLKGNGEICKWLKVGFNC